MKNYNKETLIPLALVALAVIAGGYSLVSDLRNPSSPTSVAVTPGQNPDAQITVLSVSADATAAAAGANTRIVKWQSQNYPAGATVSINLIKKVSDSPTSYEFVRTLAVNTQNDGIESWSPAAKESGDSFFIEVVCGDSSGFTTGCHASGAPVSAF